MNVAELNQKAQAVLDKRQLQTLPNLADQPFCQLALAVPDSEEEPDFDRNLTQANPSGLDSDQLVGMLLDKDPAANLMLQYVAETNQPEEVLPENQEPEKSAQQAADLLSNAWQALNTPPE